MESNFDRFERDVGLKCFYAGRPEKIQSKSNLYLKSSWRPPLPPAEIDTRLCFFFKALRQIIHRKRGGSNLSLFQQKLLNELRATDSIVIAHADKGRGPVGVPLSLYIEWGLTHLTDPKSYEIISEEQGLADDKILCKEIFD